MGEHVGELQIGLHVVQEMVGEACISRPTLQIFQGGTSIRNQRDAGALQGRQDGDRRFHQLEAAADRFGSLLAVEGARGLQGRGLGLSGCGTGQDEECKNASDHFSTLASLKVIVPMAICSRIWIWTGIFFASSESHM